MPTQRQLQAIILAREDCAPHVHTNDMPKISGVEAYAKDQTIADILNGAGVGTGTQEVEAWKAKRYLIKRLKWRAIVDAADNPLHPAREACMVAVDLAETDSMWADFADPDTAPMWGALVATSLLTAAERDEIQSWCRTPSTITAEQVSRALRGPWDDGLGVTGE